MDITEYTITIELIQNMMHLIITKIKNNADKPMILIQQLTNLIENLRNYYSKINFLLETKNNTALKVIIDFQEQLFPEIKSIKTETEIKKNIDNLETYIKNNELIIDILKNNFKNNINKANHDNITKNIINDNDLNKIQNDNKNEIIESGKTKNKIKKTTTKLNTTISIEGEYNKVELVKTKANWKKIISEYYNFCYKSNNIITKFNFKNGSRNNKFYYCYKRGKGC